jgi:hypothetical protein
VLSLRAELSERNAEAKKQLQVPDLLALLVHQYKY